VIIGIITISSLSVIYLINSQKSTLPDDVTEQEAKAGIKKDVEIYDLYFMEKSGTSIFNPGSAYGRENVIRFYHYTSGQVNVEAGFRDMTFGIMLINFYPIRHGIATSEHNVKLVFKNGYDPVFIISETIPADRWSDFKILFNGETFQHRLYINDQLIYGNHSYIYKTSIVNNVEIISDGYKFSLYTQFKSLIGYELLES
jgi:hypothetical protein